MSIAENTSALKKIDVAPLLSNLYDLVIALDTEYVAEPIQGSLPLGLYPERACADLRNRNCQTNRILSYQMYSVNTRTGQTSELIIYPPYDERLTLGHLLTKACNSIGISTYSLRAQRHEPLHVLVAWHWGSAEVGSLADREWFLRHEDEIVDIGGGVISLSDVLYTFPLDSHRHQGKVVLTLRDTTRLLDKRTKLESLGETLGIHKVSISPYSKDRMDILLEQDQALFERYGMTDCRIVWEWINQTARNNEEVLHLQDQFPPTTGSASAAGLREFMGENFAKAFCIQWNHALKRYMPSQNRYENESYMKLCFKGGCNQSYRLGKVEGNILDIDLDSAYSSAMGMIPGIKWDGGIDQIKDPTKITGLMDFAAIYFSFPEDTEFPCIPISTKHGLCYPLSNFGEQEPAHVSSIEIQEALALGATIKVYSSRCFQTTEDLLLAPYIKYLVQKRLEYRKGTPQNLAAKLALNSLYGKFGQSVSARSTNNEIFSQEELEEGRQLKPSPITCPHIASAITGLVRAVLLVLVNEASKLGMVLSATTDGLMVCLSDRITKQEALITLMAHCEEHPSVKLLLTGRQNVGLTGPWLEVKHEGKQAITLKTRCNWMGDEQGNMVYEARVGFGSEPENPDYISFATLYNIARSHETAFYNKIALNKFKDMQSNPKQPKKILAQDVTAYLESSVVNIAPDWKRFFLPDGTSRPYTSMQEFHKVRRVVDNLKEQAFPDQVAFSLRRRFTSKAMCEKAIKRAVLHRIAQGIPGYRLPKGSKFKDVCEQLGVNSRALTRLKGERLEEFPKLDYQEEAQRIIDLLKLW